MNENRDNRVEDDIIDVRDEDIEMERRADERTERRAAETRAPADVAPEGLEPLFEDNEANKFRTQWLNIQSRFVDDPREAVKQADELVASILKSVTMSFSDRRVSLEKQWNSGENISTEDLRVALKRYRSFFDRLLTLES
jgi:uncharacterized protein YcbX